MQGDIARAMDGILSFLLAWTQQTHMQTEQERIVNYALCNTYLRLDYQWQRTEKNWSQSDDEKDSPFLQTAKECQATTSHRGIDP